MSQEEILKRNEAIAVFMGAKLKVPTNTKYAPCYQYFREDGLIYREKETQHMEYKTNWSWLMPVVEKIEKDHGMNISIESDYVTMFRFNDRSGTVHDEGCFGGYTKIDAVFKVVSDFCLNQVK
jgi:hypothetical protein